MEKVGSPPPLWSKPHIPPSFGIRVLLPPQIVSTTAKPSNLGPPPPNHRSLLGSLLYVRTRTQVPRNIPRATEGEPCFSTHHHSPFAHHTERAPSEFRRLFCHVCDIGVRGLHTFLLASFPPSLAPCSYAWRRAGTATVFAFCHVKLLAHLTKLPFPALLPLIVQGLLWGALVVFRPIRGRDSSRPFISPHLCDLFSRQLQQIFSRSR